MDSSPVDQIKQKLDIVEFIGEYIRLTKAGRNYKARCPFHSEKTPSFMVSPERQIWHCFGCGQGGDIFGFVMKMEGIEFGDALRLLARKAGVVLQKQNPQIQSQKKRLYELCELATKFFEAQLDRSATGKKVQLYLKERGLESKIIKDWRLGWAPDEWRALYDFLKGRGYKEQEILQAGLIAETSEQETSAQVKYYDRFRSRIIFPIFDIQGQVVAFGGRIFEIPTNYESKRITNKEKSEPAKYVNSPQTPLYDKSGVLYGLHKSKIEIREKDQCIIVEGYMDLLMSWQGEVRNVVASSGTALTEGQLGIIGRYTKNLAMAFDADAAGVTATRRSIDLALRQDFNVKVISIKDKDPAEVVKKNPKAWQAAAAGAQSVMEFYFDSTFAKFSGSAPTPDQRKKICGDLLPIIKNISSRVEQSEWIKELARHLRVEEKDLIFDLSRYAGSPAGRQKDWSEESAIGREVAPDKAVAKSRLEELEERFLGLCLNYPQQFQNLTPAWECDFQDEKLGQIFNHLKKLIEEKKEKDPVNHLHHLLSVELNIQVDYLSLKIQRQPVMDELQIISEIEACLKELKIVKIRHRLTALSFEIKEAQVENNKSKISNFLEKFSQLSSELIELTRE
jgi:DNA primase